MSLATRSRPALLLLALLLGAPAARAEERDAPPPDVRVAFADGWAAGVAKAKSPDALLFVYFGRHRPFCPGCARLERGPFAEEAAAALGTRWTAVRILGGEEATADSEALMERFGVEGFPTLMAVTAGGEVVERDLLAGSLRSADELVAGMEAAESAQEAFLAERKELLEAADAESLMTLAERYLLRGAPGRAADLMQELAKKTPSPEAFERVAVLRMEAGDAAGEKAALDHLLARWPEHERSIHWRMRRAVVDLPTRVLPAEARALAERHLDALDALRDERAKAGAVEDEAEVRFRTATLRLQLGKEHDEAGRADLAWILEHAPASAAARRAHLALANLAVREGALAKAKQHASAVVESAARTEEGAEARLLLADLAFAEDDLAEAVRQYEAILEESPGTEAAERAERALPGLQREADSR